MTIHKTPHTLLLEAIREVSGLDERGFCELVRERAADCGNTELEKQARQALMRLGDGPVKSREETADSEVRNG
jgi:hypothetical protein